MPGRIVITGAAGFIGRRVAHHATAVLPRPLLRLTAHRNTLLLPAAAPLAGIAPQIAPQIAPEIVTADLSDPASLRGLCAGAEVLVHCASRIGGSPETCRTVNTRGTEALVGEALRSGVSRIVYLSTAAVHGRGPFRDARPADLPIAPLSATSRSRAEAEQAVLAAGGTVLRPHIVYGVGDRWVGPRIAGLMQTLGATVDTWQSRLSLIDVDDLARALLGVALAPATSLTASVYHANHPAPVTAETLLRTLAEATDLPWPTEDIGYPAARDRLAARGGSVHDLDMLTTDHWFDSTPLWSDLARDPGPGFPDRFPAGHTAWYRQALRTA